MVSSALGRKFVGVELNPEYVAITMKRIAQHEAANVPVLRKVVSE